MKNAYEIRGETTAILLKSPKYGAMETLIATSDLTKAQEYEGTWTVNWDPRIGSFYVVGSMKNSDNTRVSLRLHRWVLGITDSKIHVDHILHDTLDNTRWATNCVSQAENSQNVRLSKTNTSGVTGVKWNVASNRWVVNIQVKRQRKYLGSFLELKEAKAARKLAEEEHYLYKQAIC